jgi:hypothetical protein
VTADDIVCSQIVGDGTAYVGSFDDHPYAYRLPARNANVIHPPRIPG